MNEDIVIPIAGMIMVVVIVIGFPLTRAWVKRWEHDGLRPRSEPESAARLERIEQAIDAMAVEVERISEGQRFVSRLMSERRAEPVPLPGAERARNDQR
jgi:hypothetical protein